MFYGTEMFQELHKDQSADSKCWKFCAVFMKITYFMKDKIFNRGTG